MIDEETNNTERPAPPKSTIVGGVISTIKHHGLLSSMSSGCKFMWDSLWDRYFDWRMGVKTSRRVSIDKLGHETDENHFHIASDYRTFKRVMNRIGIREDEDVFLDYGSGLGRMLILADHLYRFKKIIGVELSPDMVELSRLNIAKARKKGKLQSGNIEVHHADATRYAVPGEVTIIYFYNPFSGTVLNETLSNIRASLDATPRELTIIVKSPEHFEPEAAKMDWLEKKTVIGKGIRYAYHIYRAR